MPVQVTYNNVGQGTIRMDIMAPITWYQYHDGINDVVALARQDNSPKYFIMTANTDVPRDNPLFHLRHAMQTVKPVAQLQGVYIVLPGTKLPFARSLTRLVFRLASVDRQQYHVVDSYEAALRDIQRKSMPNPL